jgi:hypothetical protein
MNFAQMLAGGHPNSLGRTLEVVDAVLQDQKCLPDLLACYTSSDEVVRLRTSNALKRVTIEHPEWVAPFLDHLLLEVAKIEQASTQWTLAILFGKLVTHMNPTQKTQAQNIMQQQLENHTDWIVLNNAMETLSVWAKSDPDLKKWLEPQLLRHITDPRKSVSGRAKKFLEIQNSKKSQTKKSMRQK